MLPRELALMRNPSGRPPDLTLGAPALESRDYLFFDPI
jgi:hypothetical protein